MFSKTSPSLSFSLSLSFACLSLFSATAHAQFDGTLLDLSAGMHRIQAEVAYTDPMRQRGLMQRKDMPQQQGMLFVFPQAAQHCMWMKNTLLPLAVAFMDDEGRIINVEEMQPQSEQNHCAKKPARYALEMNSGWFSRRGFAAGTRINGVEKAPKPQ